MSTNKNVGYISSLTSLRGIAAWWVVIYHFREALGLQPESQLLQTIEKGYIAVDFFFILSGFVIFINYHSSFLQPSFQTVRDFLVKRLARVYPLHLVIMLLFLASPLALNLFSNEGFISDRYDPYYYLASLLMIQNWGFFDNLAWNIPAWSISTEFGAYLAFPFLAVILQKWFNSHHWHLVALLLLSLTLVFIFISAGYTSLGGGIPDVGLVRCIIEFSMGAVIGHFYLNHLQERIATGYWCLVAALFLLIVTIVFKLPDYIFIPSIFALLIIFAAVDKHILKPVLELRILIYLGQISYSTYLVHYLTKDWVKFLSNQIGVIQFFTYILVVFLSSAILFRFVENPGRKWINSVYQKR